MPKTRQALQNENGVTVTMETPEIYSSQQFLYCKQARAHDVTFIGEVTVAS